MDHIYWSVCSSSRRRGNGVKGVEELNRYFRQLRTGTSKLFYLRRVKFVLGVDNMFLGGNMESEAHCKFFLVGILRFFLFKHEKTNRFIFDFSNILDFLCC